MQNNSGSISVICSGVHKTLKRAMHMISKIYWWTLSMTEEHTGEFDSGWIIRFNKKLYV